LTKQIKLVEFQEAYVQLSLDEARALSESDFVNVRPTWINGEYAVKAGAKVGVLSFDEGLVVSVAPKLPMRRVVTLLCLASGLADWDDRLIEIDDSHALDVAIAEAFLNASERVMRLGIISSYFAVSDDLQSVKGRIDMNRYRLRFGITLPVSVDYDDFGTNIIENRLIAGASRLLQRLPNLPANLHERLRRISAYLSDVVPAGRHEARNSVVFSRLNSHYRPAVALARAVLEGASFDIGQGSRTSVGFTVNMNVLFEEFVGAMLTIEVRRHGVGTIVRKRSDFLDEGSTARIVPDLTWMEDNQPKAIIDAKYKSLDSQQAQEADIYQAVAYSNGLGVEIGYLIYATEMAENLLLKIRHSAVAIFVVGLDLNVPYEDMRSQFEGIANQLPATQHPELLVLAAGQ